MRSRAIFAGAAAALFLTVSAQEGLGSYCDELNRCFASFTSDHDIVWGFAIPVTTAAPFDVILQVTAPIDVGWAGLSWGGSMTYSPLAITWANGDSVVVASRMAFGYSVPPSYTNATYTLLDGSYTNDTHFVATALCKGCSSWDPTGGDLNVLDPAATNTFAFGYSTSQVTEPGSINTTFSVHDSTGSWDQDLSTAQSPNFGTWAGGDNPGTNTTLTAVPTSTITSKVASTLSTVMSTSAATSILPLPTSCALTAAFPLAVANGWSFVKLAGEMNAPRGIVIDTEGNLLVVEAGVGVTAHTFRSDGCIASNKTLISSPTLNHGITLTPDGAQLIVSSSTNAWRYTYDAVAQSVADEEVVVAGMDPGGHPTRTVVIPPGTPNLLIVSHGSNSNLDLPTIDKSVGRALVKVFDLTSVPSGGYDFKTSGSYLGYGLRNEVAIVVDNNNMIWGVENSADDFQRTVNGQNYDIHNGNPAEELNYLGDPSVANENWYGYPTCFTVWNGSLFPDGDPATGSQFLPAPNDTYTDATCESNSVGPRLSLQAHTAPLDGKFNEIGSNIYVTLHGSWDSDTPAGFKVVEIPFTTSTEGGFEPVAAADSNNGYNDILWDTQQGCSISTCFRPSGLAWDSAFSRMFVASDNPVQGELYMLAKTG